MFLKTRSLRTYRRFGASDSEKIRVEIVLHCSQEELEQLRKKFFEEGR
jgi:hypothetical protein